MSNRGVFLIAADAGVTHEQLCELAMFLRDNGFANSVAVPFGGAVPVVREALERDHSAGVALYVSAVRGLEWNGGKAPSA